MKRILLIACGVFALVSAPTLAQLPPLPQPGQPPSLEQQRPPQQQQWSPQQQHSLNDMIAQKVVEHFQALSCEQLKSKKSELKPAMVQDFVKLLRSDVQIRTEFINKVAAPIANRMFECGMIP